MSELYYDRFRSDVFNVINSPKTNMGSVLRKLAAIRADPGCGVSTLTDAIALLTVSHITQGCDVSAMFEEIAKSVDEISIHQADIEARLARMEGLWRARHETS